MGWIDAKGRPEVIVGDWFLGGRSSWRTATFDSAAASGNDADPGEAKDVGDSNEPDSDRE